MFMYKYLYINSLLNRDTWKVKMDTTEMELFQRHAETCCIFCNERRLMIMSKGTISSDLIGFFEKAAKYCKEKARSND